MKIRELNLWILSIFALLIFTSNVTAQTVEVADQQPRLTKKDIEERLNRARTFFREKQYEQSLADYLFVFDNSRGISGYGGVRVFFFLRYISDLGNDYPPARKALEDRRNKNE